MNSRVGMCAYCATVMIRGQRRDAVNLTSRVYVINFWIHERLSSSIRRFVHSSIVYVRNAWHNNRFRIFVKNATVCQLSQNPRVAERWEECARQSSLYLPLFRIKKIVSLLIAKVLFTTMISIHHWLLRPLSTIKHLVSINNFIHIYYAIHSVVWNITENAYCETDYVSHEIAFVFSFFWSWHNNGVML